MDVQERLNLGREALGDNVLPSKCEAIFLYDLIHELQEDNEQLKEENRILQMEIGKYAGQIQEVIGKQQALCREGLKVARNMFSPELK